MTQSAAFKLNLYVMTIALALAIGHARKSRTSALKPEISSQLDTANDTRGGQTAHFPGKLNVDDRSRLPRDRETAGAVTSKKRRQRRGRRKGLPKQDDVAAADILRDTMIQMFGFNHMSNGMKPCLGDGLDCNAGSPGPSRSSRAGGRRSVSQRFKPNPPNFMLELYRTYSEDKDLMMLHLKSQGNTVRSFFPSAADPLYRESNFGKSVSITPVPLPSARHAPITAFLFDVTAIPSLEELVAAEIRMDGNAPDPRATEVVTAVYRLQKTECADGVDCQGLQSKVFSKAGKSLFLTSLPGATIWSDPRLVKLAEKARKPGRTLVLKFSAHADANQLRRPRRHFEASAAFDDLPQSFVAQDRDTAKRSKREPNVSPLLDSSQDHAATPVTPVLIVYCNDSRAAAQTETPTAAPGIWHALGNMTTSVRKKVKRSVSLPEESPPSDDSGSAHNTTSAKRPRDTAIVVDKRRGDPKRRRKGKQVASPGNATAGEDSGSKRGKKREGRRGGRRRKGRRNRKIKLHPSLASELADGRCGRKSLHVKFEDIGWSEWIISPQYFDAYYCTGACKLSQMQESDTGTTNHAIIQSVVKSLAGHDYLPAPCCTPDKLMSLSVLFFDEHRNVVLKVFPNMSVETCACR